MPFQPNDILLAFKHIALCELNGTETQFAAFLIDSYNRKTGRCDPSEETAAHILGKSTRTIIRAGARLVALRFFRKRKHAGNNHCNSYEPNWELFRERESIYKRRRTCWAGRFDRLILSPSPSQSIHLESDNAASSKCQIGHNAYDKDVTQTCSTNHIESTCLTNTIPSTLPKRSPNQQPLRPDQARLGNEESYQNSSAGSRRQGRLNLARSAAETAGLRRWNSDLLLRFRSMPKFGAVVDAVDLAMQNAATEAELKQRGGGVAFIVSELLVRGVLSTDDQGLKG